MTPQPLETEVREILGVILGQPGPVPPDYHRTHAAEWDSLKHVEVVFALEDQFQVRFEEADFPALDSVASIARRISELREA